MPRHTTAPVFAGLLCIAAAGLVLAAVPSPAAACVCGPKTDEEVIRSTPIILTGRVIEVRRPPGLGQVTATIEVLERWKGEVPDRVSVHGWISNNSCEMGAPFSLGATMVFLVRPSRTGDDFRVGDMCSTYRAGLPGRPVPASFAAALARHRAERQRVDRAAAAAPGSASALLDKARFLETDQQLPDAIALYAEAARLAPDLPAAHLGEGRALFASKLFDAAQPPLRRALELQPGDPEAARLLGQARFHAGDLSVLDTLDFRGLDARSLDVSGRDLRGRDFSGARIDSGLFSGADLRGARFTEAYISRGSMARADLRGAELARVRAHGIDFSGAKLDGADLTGANVGQGDFRGAGLRGVVAPHAHFGYAALSGADFRGAHLSNARFSGARLAGTDFADAYLVNARFDGADLSGADLSRAELHGAHFHNARVDCRTRFPPGFKPDRIVLTDETCRSAYP